MQLVLSVDGCSAHMRKRDLPDLFSRWMHKHRGRSPSDGAGVVAKTPASPVPARLPLLLGVLVAAALRAMPHSLVRRGAGVFSAATYATAAAAPAGLCVRVLSRLTETRKACFEPTVA